MAVKIRLKRVGRHHLAQYRIVVADSHSPRDGRFIEELGTYEPKRQPAKVTLKVVESAPAVRGDTSKNALKDAVLETGLKTKVQLFVEEGDEIIVSTEDGSYVSRA